MTFHNWDFGMRYQWLAPGWGNRLRADGLWRSDMQPRSLTYGFIYVLQFGKWFSGIVRSTFIQLSLLNCTWPSLHLLTFTDGGDGVLVVCHLYLFNCFTCVSVLTALKSYWITFFLFFISLFSLLKNYLLL